MTSPPEDAVVCVIVVAATVVTTGTVKEGVGSGSAVAAFSQAARPINAMSMIAVLAVLASDMGTPFRLLAKAW
jgi:hypothetical protein